ncbi:hypothetical protein HPB50_008117 [Hyalomma asiaticum]|uniref:Uncharacterized protein n=1 Tax=Hyalomma asiaticum TaxID=266040 RepID=A0ACB7S533_HYAAI|nr:hypothetical protein HPB50_008117 [Hyalomma asiaticum]
MARVPHDERERIVELWLQNYSQRAIGKLTHRPLKTVNRIVQACKFDRRIKDAPRKPRRRATSHEEDLGIVAAVAENPRCSVEEIRVNLGLKASKSTVKRRLHQAGLKSRIAA